MTTASQQQGILRPVTQVEDLTAGNGQRQPKPEGVYHGTIRETRVRDLPFLKGRSPAELEKQGYTSEDVEVLSLEVAGLRPQEGQELPNNAPFFTPDIILRDGAHEILDTEIPESAWQIQRSQDAITNLAVALGAAEMVDTENGQAYYVTPEFVNALKSGDFNGTDIGFNLTVRWYATKADKAAGNGEKTGFSEEVKTYLPVV